MATNWLLRCPWCAAVVVEGLGIRDYGRKCVCRECGKKLVVPNPWQGRDYEARKVLVEKIKDALLPRGEAVLQRRRRLVRALLYGVESEAVLTLVADMLSEAFDGRYVSASDVYRSMREALGLPKYGGCKDNSFANPVSPRRFYWASDFFYQRAKWEKESEKWKDPEHCCVYPALEMEVWEPDDEDVLSRIVPLAYSVYEHWLNRWHRAKKRRRQGRFVARYDDAVWKRISLFDDPLPPFDFDLSDLSFSEVDYGDATDLRIRFKTDEDLWLEEDEREDLEKWRRLQKKKKHVKKISGVPVCLPKREVSCPGVYVQETVKKIKRVANATSVAASCVLGLFKRVRASAKPVAVKTWNFVKRACRFAVQVLSA